MQKLWIPIRSIRSNVYNKTIHNYRIFSIGPLTDFFSSKCIPQAKIPIMV
jgi:hypothetical protein